MRIETPDPQGARSPDAYEEKYMAGERVLHRDKFRAPPVYFLIFAFPILVEAAAFVALLLQKGAIPFFFYFLFPAIILAISLLALLFSVLRITVTEREIHVQYGLFGPKIPIDAVESAQEVEYDWTAYGGWGIRKGRDGSTAYNMMGDAGRAVRVTWTDDRGKKQVTLLTSPDPKALARAIQTAKTGAPTRARIAPIPDEFEREAEAEAEAALAEEGAGAKDVGGDPAVKR